jgi:hypothetical protein
MKDDITPKTMHDLVQENDKLRAKVERLRKANAGRYDAGYGDGYDDGLAEHAAGLESVRALAADEVEWVVNNIAELGVKIGNQFFFLYKGRSLVYRNDENPPIRWRLVGKREFGECCHPPSLSMLTGTYDIDTGGDWKDLPAATDGGGDDL